MSGAHRRVQLRRSSGLEPSRQPRQLTSGGVPCPACGGGSQIIDSRRYDAGVQRRRACCLCGIRFFTKELVVGDAESDAVLRAVADELREIADKLSQPLRVLPLRART